MSPPLRPRYTRIDKLVKELLRSDGCKGPPIDVEKIAIGANARVEYAKFDPGVSGVLIREKGKCIIGVAETQPNVRQRFTIAHELGHMLLHDGDAIHVDKEFRVNWRRADDMDSKNVEEVEANSFAAKLLMPHDMLSAELDSDSFEVENEDEIERLANLFQVSKLSMGFRLNQLFQWAARFG